MELVESGDAAGIIGVRLNRIAPPQISGEVKGRINAVGGVLLAVDEGGIRNETNPKPDLHDDVSQPFGPYEIGTFAREAPVWGR